MASFAERLQQALQAKGMSAAQLSRELNIDEGTISNYKKGKYEPKQRRTQAIANVLNVSVDWLMGADVPMIQNINTTAPAEDAPDKRRTLIELVKNLDDNQCELLENLIDQFLSNKNQ